MLHRSIVLTKKFLCSQKLQRKLKQKLTIRITTNELSLITLVLTYFRSHIPLPMIRPKTKVSHHQHKGKPALDSAVQPRLFRCKDMCVAWMNLYSNGKLINIFSILIINDSPSRCLFHVALPFFALRECPDVDFSLINYENEATPTTIKETLQVNIFLLDGG